MRHITVVTGARSDYGIYQPILRRIQADPELALDLIVTGMHLAPEFGNTVRQIEQDGFAIRDRIDMLLAADTPEGVSKSMGLAVLGFAQAYAREQPELLLVLGDRFEMLAAVVASLPFRIPVVHIHGGETTEGAMDEGIRHAVTKMSHFHFASTEAYARRIVQMGEQPGNVMVSGAPGLDQLAEMRLLAATQFREKFQIGVSQRPLLVTFHPVTMEYEQTEEHIDELLAALGEFGRPAVFTYPNADMGGQIIIEKIRSYVAAHTESVAVTNLGSMGYFSLMCHAAAMVGNSSSGIIEAASVELPVVNIGNRQRGRIQGRNVVNCGHSRREIMAALQMATSAPFRDSLRGLRNPYGDGRAAERIVGRLKTLTIDRNVLAKSFYDIPFGDLPERRAA